MTAPYETKRVYPQSYFNLLYSPSVVNLLSVLSLFRGSKKVSSDRCLAVCLINDY